MSLGSCCPVLALVLQRMSNAQHGLHIGTKFNFKSATTRDALVVRFKRGAKGEEHRESTFAWAKFCPFCGTKVEEGPATSIVVDEPLVERESNDANGDR